MDIWPKALSISISLSLCESPRKWPMQTLPVNSTNIKNILAKMQSPLFPFLLFRLRLFLLLLPFLLSSSKSLLFLVPFRCLRVSVSSIILKKMLLAYLISVVVEDSLPSSPLRLSFHPVCQSVFTSIAGIFARSAQLRDLSHILWRISAFTCISNLQAQENTQREDRKVFEN